MPGAAVHVEQHRERTGALRLIDPRHQRPPGRVAAEFDLAHRELVVRGGIVSIRAFRCCPGRGNACARHGPHEFAACDASASHSDLRDYSPVCATR